MNLREKKKQATRDTILACARKLFFENGYAGTSIEKIAECSQVAVGTIYNYFGSKAGIIIAISSRDADGLMVQFTDEDLQSKTVEEMIWTILEGSLSYLVQYPRELIRELFASMFVNSHDELAQGLSREDKRFITYMAELLKRLVKMGKVKEQTDPEAASFAIYSLVFGGLVWYLADDKVDIEHSNILIASMVGQFCRGILPEGSF